MMLCDRPSSSANVPPSNQGTRKNAATAIAEMSPIFTGLEFRTIMQPSCFNFFAAYGGNILAHYSVNGPHVHDKKGTARRMLKKPVQQGRR